jgi:translation initiation factor 4G
LKDLRAQGWHSKKAGNTVMTIAEVHKQAAQEQARKAAQANASRESISRGGSKTGHRRDAPGEWQSVAPTARLPQRPVDASRMGGLSTGAGAPSFGPSSVFTNRKKGGAATPPSLSRQQSSANMFSALGQDEAAAPVEAAEQPQRKRLNLKPRTKPMPGEDGGEEGGEEGEEEEGEGEGEGEDEAEEPEVEAAPAKMGEQGAKTKIDLDMKELWGEKDQGGHRNADEIVEYFKALPEEHHGLLAERLFSEIFRISKIPDAEVVAKGLAKAKEAGIPVAVLRRG